MLEFLHLKRSYKIKCLPLLEKKLLIRHGFGSQNFGMEGPLKVIKSNPGYYQKALLSSDAENTCTEGMEITFSR